MFILDDMDVDIETLFKIHVAPPPPESAREHVIGCSHT